MTAPADGPTFAEQTIQHIRDLDPQILERGFTDAVGRGDTEGVEAFLRLLLVVDPPRAIRLHDDLKAALRLAEVIEVVNLDGSAAGGGR